MRLDHHHFGLASAGLLAFAANGAAAQIGEIPGRGLPYYGGHDMMWGTSQWGGFGMILGPIILILTIVGIVAGTAALLRYLGVSTPAGGATATQDRALAILKERYAKGEIDSTEFAERKKHLAD